MLRGQLLIDSDGSQVGQVNGLAVVVLDDAAPSHPARITATVRAGEGGQVVDIEREVRLGGPIHSKGVLILSSLPGGALRRARRSRSRPAWCSSSPTVASRGQRLAGRALRAAVGALGVPIRQSLAVTGSVNQLGAVQPIGGVNEKIEGFFDLCAARSLSGEQGVLIPQANVCHLMLRSDVVDAVRAGRFRIWAVGDVDQGLELLTGQPAGKPDAQGRMAAGSSTHRSRPGWRAWRQGTRRRSGCSQETRPAGRQLLTRPRSGELQWP